MVAEDDPGIRGVAVLGITARASSILGKDYVTQLLP